jgi:hypothetical protein
MSVVCPCTYRGQYYFQDLSNLVSSWSTGGTRVYAHYMRLVSRNLTESFSTESCAKVKASLNSDSELIVMVSPDQGAGGRGKGVEKSTIKVRSIALCLYRRSACTDRPIVLVLQIGV